MQETKGITKPIRSKKNLGRRLARLVAVQALYSLEANPDLSADQTVFDLIGVYKSGKMGDDLVELDEGLLVKLARGANYNKDNLVLELSPLLAEDWKFNRLARVMQSILLVAAYDLKISKEEEAAIIINEYIEISKLLGHEGESGFVNKVMDSLAKVWKQ
jgi:N utilization substance protein B